MIKLTIQNETINPKNYKRLQRVIRLLDKYAKKNNMVIEVQWNDNTFDGFNFDSKQQREFLESIGQFDRESGKVVLGE